MKNGKLKEEEIIAFWKIWSNHWGGIKNKTNEGSGSTDVTSDNDYEESSEEPDLLKDLHGRIF